MRDLSTQEITCTVCHQTLPLSAYYVHKKNNRPLSTCKECCKERTRKTRLNPERQIRATGEYTIWHESVRGRLMTLLGHARKRSKIRELGFDLTVDDLLEMYEKQAGRCSLTGIEFSLSGGFDGKNNPFAPSIDRIVAGGAYSKANVRLVCTAVNFALGDWGEPVFRLICENYLRAAAPVSTAGVEDSWRRAEPVQLAPARKRGNAPGAPSVSKLCAEDIIKIRQLRNEGMIFSDIAKQFDVTTGCIQYIIAKKTWKHVVDVGSPTETKV